MKQQRINSDAYAVKKKRREKKSRLQFAHCGGGTEAQRRRRHIVAMHGITLLLLSDLVLFASLSILCTDGRRWGGCDQDTHIISFGSKHITRRRRRRRRERAAMLHQRKTIALYVDSSAISLLLLHNKKVDSSSIFLHYSYAIRCDSAAPRTRQGNGKVQEEEMEGERPETFQEASACNRIK